jgi:hypothetical protein
MMKMPFYIVCPEEGISEEWRLTIKNDKRRHINGTYYIMDSYCLDSTCDCQNVTLSIIGKHDQIKASIAYGWRSPSFYKDWGLDKETTKLLTRGFLDYLAPQSKDAEILFEYVSQLLADPDTTKYLKARYDLFKKTIDITGDPLEKINIQQKSPNVIPFSKN